MLSVWDFVTAITASIFTIGNTASIFTIGNILNFQAGDLSNGTNTKVKLFVTNPEDNSNSREIPVPPDYFALE